MIDTIVELQSASKLWRWGFEKLLESFNKWKADILISNHIDRISRNPIDEWNIKWLAQQWKIKEIHSAEWIFNWQQILLLSLHLAMANQYTNDLSIKVKEWVSTKLKNGWIVWPAPLWYINNKETKQAEVDDNIAPFIIEVFKLRKEWHSTQLITDVMREKWMMSKQTKKRKSKPISKKTIELILKNPFYYWVIKYSWELYEWSHKPLVSKDVYDRVNNIKRWIKYVKDRDLTPLKWIVTHKETWNTLCTSLIKKKYIYFHMHWDTKMNFWYNQKNIIEHFDKVIEQYLIPEEYLDNTKEWLAKEFTDKLEENKKKKVLYKKKITELDNEKPWLIKMRRKWELTSEEFLEEKNKIVNEIKKYESYITQINDEDEKILEELNISVELYIELNIIWKTLSDYQKALIISKMFVELKIDNQKRLWIKEKPTFKAFRELNMCKWSGGRGLNSHTQGLKP